MSKTKHTTAYYKKKYKQIQNYIIDENLTNPFGSVDSFISVYEGYRELDTKDVLGKIKYDLKYETNYKTAKAEYKAQKEFGGKLKFKDIQKMSTQDFADTMKNQINDFYKEMRAKGLKSTEIGKFISSYWFGSD